MAETYGDYFTGLGRSIGQGVTFGFGDEIEAGIRALGAGTYDEEVAKIRAELEKFRETNPVSAYGSEIAASLPTGLGLGALALRAGVRGIGKIGAAEGALYGAGVGEDAEDRAVSAAIGAPLGAAGAVVGEKVVRGIAPMIGKFMKRGSGSETRGATDIQLDAGDQPIPATEADGARFFDPADVKKEVSSAHNDLSRETIIYMSPDEFLSLAKKEPGYDFDLTEVRGLIEEGTPFSSMPSLSFDHDGKGMAKVVGHEGRHRMLALKELGVETVPVKFNSRERGEGRALRWGQQANPDSNDYVPPSERPVQITSEDGDVVLPMFDSIIYPADLRPRATVFDVETGVTSPLEKTVGEPLPNLGNRPSGPGGINPVTKDPLLGPFTADYSPIENALANAERVMNASPTKGLTGEQYLARLAEQPSVTKTELNASGLASFLSRPENKRRKIPVAEVQQYMKENAPNIEVFKYTGDQNNVTYRETQRFMDENAYSEVGYGEITTNNRNAHPATLGHMLSHYRDQLGNFAHVRYSDHNDASGGVSRVIEENQFDLLQSLLSQERGGELSRIRTVKLTPEKVADYDARIEKLRASPEYPAFRQTGDALTDAGEKVYNAEGVRNGLRARIDDLSTKRKKGRDLALSQLTNAGKMRAAETFGFDGSDEALIQMVSSDFLEDTVFRAIRSTQAENQNYSPSSDEIGQIITRAINSTPEQLVSEILEAAKKRGQKVPRIAPVAQTRIAQFASKYATPSEKAMLLASSRIQSDAVFTFKSGFESVVLSPSPDTALLGRMMDSVPSQEEASRIVRQNMAKAMSAPRQLKVTSDILEQDFTTTANLEGELNRAVDSLDAAKKARANAAIEYETSAKKLVRKNKAITGRTALGDADADTKGFFEYAQKTNFLPRDVNPVDPKKRAQLVPNQPFDTPLQAARHNILMAIDDAIDEGVDRIYFPDYRDMSGLRGVNPEGFFKTVYKDAPEKVIKELKQKFPNLKSGRISPEDFVGDHLGEIGDEAQVTHPVLYLDITPASIDRLGIPRRYAKGGPVDLRSGIGNMFRLYS